MLNVCEAMAERVMFEADSWNIDSLSSSKTFRFPQLVNTKAHCNWFPTPAPSKNATIGRQHEAKKQQSFLCRDGEKTTFWVKKREESHFSSMDFLEIRPVHPRGSSASFRKRMGSPFAFLLGDLSERTNRQTE